MAINNPYIPGDPYSYDLKWIVAKVKEILQQLGTLDEAIEKKIFEGFVEHSIVQFHNVADMLAAEIKDGSIVLTLGYYEPGDLGALFYLIKDFNPGQCSLDYFLTMDNNAQIAIPLFIYPYVTPEMFGAKGDEANDDADAINKALTIGLPVVLEKRYLIGSMIDVPSVSRMSGSGTLIADTDVLIYGENVEDVTIEKLKIDGSRRTDSVSEYLVFFKDSENITIEKTTVTDARGYAIEFSACENVKIRENMIDRYYYVGIGLSMGCVNCVVNKNTVLNGYGHYGSPANRYPITLAGYGVTSGFNPTKGIICTENYIEDTEGVWEGIDAHTLQDSVISNNVIKGTASGITITTLNYANPPLTDNVIIDGNVIELTKNFTNPGAARDGITAAWQDPALSAPQRYQGGHVTISNNVIKNVGYGVDGSGNPVTAAFLFYGLDVTITGNTVIDPVGYVFYASGNYRPVTASANQIVNYNQYATPGNSALIRYTAGDSPVTLVGNDFGQMNGKLMYRSYQAAQMGGTMRTLDFLGNAYIGTPGFMQYDSVRTDKGITPVSASYAYDKGDIVMNVDTATLRKCTAAGDYSTNTYCTFAVIS